MYFIFALFFCLFQQTFPHHEAEYDPDLNYGAFGGQGTTVNVYKTVNHIQHVGVLNIGPQFNFGTNNFTASPAWNDENDYDSHLEKCRASQRMIENNEIEAIAPKIDGDLAEIGRQLELSGIDELLKAWESEEDPSSSQYSTAYRLLFFWAQVKDKVSSLK